MNYFSPLDTFFSSPWLSFGTLIGLLIVLFLFRKPLFINRKRKGVLGVLYSTIWLGLLFIILIFNPIYFGYGKSIGMKQVVISGDTLCIVDYRLEAGGEGDEPTPIYRVHLLELRSGEKQRRFLVGRDADVLFLNGNEIVVKGYNEVMFYNAANGKAEVSWSEETLPGLYPELKTGVDQLQHYEDARASMVTSKDGKRWLLNMTDHSIRQLEDGNDGRNIYDQRPGMLVKDDGIYSGKHNSTDQQLLALKGKAWDDKRKQLRNASDSILNKELFFVEGVPVMVSEKDSCVVILHYETTDKMSFLLTAMSLDGKKKIWEIDQKNIHPNEEDTPTETCWAFDEVSGLLVFCLQDEVMAVNVKDGKIVWKKEL